MLLLTQDGQKLHIGLAPLAMPRNKLASDVVFEVLIRIAGLKPAQFEFMLTVNLAELV
jgi:hypothetical protein